MTYMHSFTFIFQLDMFRKKTLTFLLSLISRNRHRRLLGRTMMEQGLDVAATLIAQGKHELIFTTVLVPFKATRETHAEARVNYCRRSFKCNLALKSTESGCRRRRHRENEQNREEEENAFWWCARRWPVTPPTSGYVFDVRRLS